MVPVIDALSPHVRVSVDTVKAAVAEAAVAAGATLVNDISAILWPVAAAPRGGMGGHAHAAGRPATMQDDPRYDDVVAEVPVLRRGPGPPGHRGRGGRGVGGPGHRVRQDRGSQPVPAAPPARAGRRAGFPVLVGTSRKSFLGRLSPRRRRTTRARVEDRLAGSLATATWAMLAGAAMVRVHDVAAAVQAATLVGETALVPA